METDVEESKIFVFFRSLCDTTMRASLGMKKNLLDFFWEVSTLTWTLAKTRQTMAQLGLSHFDSGNFINHKPKSWSEQRDLNDHKGQF